MTTESFPAPVSARSEMIPAPEVSVVVPMYDEEANVASLVAAVSGVLDRAGISHEILLVDDGSSDATWSEILAAAATNSSARGLRLSRNFGHQQALTAGLRHARGQAVVTMDGDLQHPPEILVALHAAWHEGYKVVNTRRTDSADTGLLKRVSSRAFYSLFSRLSGVKMEPGSADFRLLDRTVVDSLAQMGDVDPFLRGQVGWLGFASRTVDYMAANRHAGAPKFTVGKMLRFATGAVTSFSVLPLRLGIGIGFATSALAFVELLYILVAYSQGRTVPGWASLMTVMSFMFGILFILLGIIGAYLGKVYDILKHRPAFVIAERVGFANTER